LETGTNNPANGTAGSTLKGGLSGGGASDSGEINIISRWKYSLCSGSCVIGQG